jgi:hypothetical protein
MGLLRRFEGAGDRAMFAVVSDMNVYVHFGFWFISPPGVLSASTKSIFNSFKYCITIVIHGTMQRIQELQIVACFGLPMLRKIMFIYYTQNNLAT